METIVACRDNITERFPVASFTVTTPEPRFYEVACATDPRLFHTDHATRRTRENFYSSRGAGLIHGAAGRNTFILPPDQLRRFAGARRLYYALGTYAGPRGDQPRFTIAPDELERVPSIRVASDFTGRTLDRRRLGAARPSRNDAYGGARAVLRWGGDQALEAERASRRSAVELPAGRRSVDYDDGYGAMPGSGPTPGYGATPDGRYRSAAGGAAASARGHEVGLQGNLVRPDDLEDDAAIETMDGGAPVDEGRREDLDADGEAYGRPRARARTRPQPARSQPRPPGVVEDGREAHASGRARKLAAARPSTRSEPASRYGRAQTRRATADACEDGASARAAGRARTLNLPAATTRRPRFGAVASSRAPSQSFEDGASLRAQGGRAVGLPVEPPAGQPRARRGYGRPGSRSCRGRSGDYREHPIEESLAVGPATRPLSAAATSERTALTIADKVRLLRVVARVESGDDGYTAVYADGEFDDPEHPFYRQTHVGLSWGLLLFTQRSGAIARVVRLAKQREDDALRDPAAAASVPDSERMHALFGPDLEALLEWANAAAHDDSADVRLAPVAGAPLWQSPWLDRFRRAGAVGYVQAAQNQVAVEDYFDAALPYALALGLDTARGLAVLVDRLIHMGVGAGGSWIMAQAGPIRSESDRERALEQVGFARDLAGFQRSRSLDPTGWDARTHAELVRALREQGSRVIAMPDRLDPQVFADGAREAEFGARVEALLANNDDFDDSVAFDLH